MLESRVQELGYWRHLLALLKNTLAQMLLKMKSPGAKNRVFFKIMVRGTYDGLVLMWWHSTCATVVPAFSSALCHHPQKETHIRKLFHVHLNRNVVTEFALGLEPRSPPPLPAPMQPSHPVWREGNCSTSTARRLLHGSLYACLDLMSCVLCESY